MTKGHFPGRAEEGKFVIYVRDVKITQHAERKRAVYSTSTSVVVVKLVCPIFFLGSVKGHSRVKPRAVMRVVRKSVGGRKQ